MVLAETVDAVGADLELGLAEQFVHLPELIRRGIERIVLAVELDEMQSQSLRVTDRRLQIELAQGIALDSDRPTAKALGLGGPN